MKTVIAIILVGILVVFELQLQELEKERDFWRCNAVSMHITLQTENPYFSKEEKIRMRHLHQEETKRMKSKFTEKEWAEMLEKQKEALRKVGALL